MIERRKQKRLDCASFTVKNIWIIFGFLMFLSPVTTLLAETEAKSAEGIAVPNPAVDLWRAVRQRDVTTMGTTQVKGVDSAFLINPYAEQWRRFRMQILLPVGGYVLLGAFLLILAVYFIRGKVRLEGGFSAQKLFRYEVYERMLHWFMASIFLFLAVTGLILLFGRSLLMPWIGQEAFSVLASASKEGHNLFGPLFLIALILLFVRFARRNIYQKGDLTWLLRGGGIFGKKHVPSNFFNMGEKCIFWMLIIVGGVIAATGFILLFPIFGQGREWMELSHIAHSIGAIAMTTVIIGHMYIGSIGMEGALEGMKTGYCDLNWAKEHHDWWAKQCEEKGEVLSLEEVGKHLGSDQRTVLSPAEEGAEK